jgi:hypothetical protein
MDDLKVLRDQVERMREDTVRCPFCFELYAVTAYDEVLRAIEAIIKKPQRPA